PAIPDLHPSGRVQLRIPEVGKEHPAGKAVFPRDSKILYSPRLCCFPADREEDAPAYPAGHHHPGAPLRGIRYRLDKKAAPVIAASRLRRDSSKNLEDPLFTGGNKHFCGLNLEPGNNRTGTNGG